MTDDASPENLRKFLESKAMRTFYVKSLSGAAQGY